MLIMFHNELITGLMEHIRDNISIVSAVAHGDAAREGLSVYSEDAPASPTPVRDHTHAHFYI